MIRLVVIIILFSTKGWSFEGHLNYSFFDESQIESLDGPGFIDSEYSSDLIAYLPFMQSEYRFLSSQKALNINVGSISSQEFFKEQALKLKAKMSSNFNFAYYDFSYQDFEDQKSNSIIEFQYKPNNLGLSLFGDTKYHKEENDFGISIDWQKTKSHSIKLFHHWPDFDRNTRNRETDLFLRRPMAYGFSGAWFGNNKDFVHYEFKRDEKSIWAFPDESRQYTHSRSALSVKGQKNTTDKEVSYRLYLDKKDKSDSLVGTSKRSRVLSLLRFKFLEKSILNYTPQLGLAYQSREWKINGSPIQVKDIQPHIIFWGQKKAHEQNYYWWNMGYEANFHSSKGQAALMAASELKSWAVEHKANIWWNYDFFNKGLLSFVFTFDLDEFGSEGTWEGGAGQVSVAF